MFKNGPIYGILLALIFLYFELDVPIFIHPSDVMGVNDRLKDYYLRNFIGNPLDTTISMACLIFGGVFDRFPNIKFLVSHTGGFTPWIRGRWEHGYGERREPKVNGAKILSNILIIFIMTQ